MYLLFSATGLKWEALGRHFFLVSDNLITLMLPAIYAWKKGKEGMIARNTHDLDLEQQKLRKFSGRTAAAVCCEEEEEAEAHSYICWLSASEDLLCCYVSAYVCLMVRVWWPHLPGSKISVTCGAEPELPRRGKLGVRWGSCTSSAQLQPWASLPLLLGQTTVTLEGVPGAFPVAFAHRLCSVKHSEGVVCHGVGKRRRTVCVAPAGNRGMGRLWLWGMGRVVLDVPRRGPEPAVRWSDLKRLWSGKGRLERQQLDIQLTHQVRCFWMGKPNLWTWLCLERHIWPAACLITVLFSCRI